MFAITVYFLKETTKRNYMENRVKRARQIKGKKRERDREKCIKSLVCVAGRVDF